MPSSPFPDDVGRVRLRVTPRSPLAEVFLIDHEFTLVARSVGALDTKVEPGVYKVKARLGDETTETLVVLNQDRAFSLGEDLASPAPIEGTSRTHEYHMGAAADESATAATEVGSGATMFLMTRGWTAADGAELWTERSLPGLSLHGRDGETIADLNEPAGGGVDPFAGTTVRLNPGAYFVRWRDEAGFTTEQSVQAVEGWQTQVFLLDDQAHPSEGGRYRVSVLMSREAFDPFDQAPRLVEDARAALAQERDVAADFIHETLGAKFDNPMLGLFGAHLMLLAKDSVSDPDNPASAPVRFDQSLFDYVVANLRELLGSHNPDVIALSTQTTAQADPPFPLTEPPMLWRSWVLLIEASNTWPEVVPVDVWRRTLRLLPQRPFLAWASDAEDRDAVEEWERRVRRVVRGSAPEAIRGVMADEDVADEETSRRRFSRQLLAPRAAIDELARPD
jgi:hypothetical protein